MTKDKKYIENLFRNYKKNIARKKVLELGLITDDDYTLGAIDYSSDNVQTSNISSLDNRIIAREKEKEKLTNDIAITEILLECLAERDRLIITSYYIERMSAVKVAQLINRDELKTVWNNTDRILNGLIDILKTS